MFAAISSKKSLKKEDYYAVKVLKTKKKLSSQYLFSVQNTEKKISDEVSLLLEKVDDFGPPEDVNMSPIEVSINVTILLVVSLLTIVLLIIGEISLNFWLSFRQE